MSVIDSIRAKINGLKSVSDDELRQAAKELNMDFEEVKIMVERATAVSMSGSPMFKSYKSNGLNKVANILKGKGAKIKVSSSSKRGLADPGDADKETQEYNNAMRALKSIEAIAQHLNQPAKTGTWLDNVAEQVQVILKQQAGVYDQFTSKQLNSLNQDKPMLPLSPFTSQRLNAKLHPALANLPAEAFKSDDEAGPSLYEMFTSILLNPQLEEQLKELSADQRTKWYDAFTSNKLNPQRQPALQTALKEAQANAASVNAAMAARDEARMRAWQVQQAPKDAQAAKTHGRTRRLSGYYDSIGW